MKIGIDASNLRAGGGVTHLVSLLRASDPGKHGIERIVIWGSAKTLSVIEDRPWLVTCSEPVLEENAIKRAVWQRSRLAGLLAEEGCDLLFAPGGMVLTGYRPTVTMSQNLLPFEWNELRRYGMSSKALRLLTLRWLQSRSFRHAEGMIFLSDFARSSVLNVTGPLKGEIAIIPHGVDEQFRSTPRISGTYTSPERAAKLVYVSQFEPYKHQDNVVEAVVELRRRGNNVEVIFAGPAGKSFKRFDVLRRKADPAGSFIKVIGFVPHAEIASIYADADIFLFASSCENMPNILLEAMASGVPIASSDRGPMPEMLGDAGVYFDPENPRSIAQAVGELLSSVALRMEKSHAAYERALKFTWARCADETLGFLARVAKTHQR